MSARGVSSSPMQRGRCVDCPSAVLAAMRSGVLTLAFAAALTLGLTSACRATAPTAPSAGGDGGPRTGVSPEVPIEHDYGGKIVYGTSPTASDNALRQHCERLGGTFNECGTTCPPGTEICAAVCAKTCENVPLRSP